MAKSMYLSALSAEKRTELEGRLSSRQSGRCFICEKPIDVELHQASLEIDHIEPLAEQGLDAENNFALTHARCNRSKGASNLQVARRMARFERLQEDALERGERGANLGHVLAEVGGSSSNLTVRQDGDSVEFSFAEVGDVSIQCVKVHTDSLSGMRSFFATLPVEYLHHDDRINPRSIGSNIRGLIEEFRKKRPQLHVALARWAPNSASAGPVKIFDGQHKAAAQILLGVKALPVRVFINPDADVLLQTNTNAGGKLKQVAFDTAVMHHLGRSLYGERLIKYREMRGLAAENASFSEQDLVGFYRGERDMLKYILDYQRDSIMRDEENRLTEFVEWAGKGTALPLSYSAVEKSFFREFLGKKALAQPLNHLEEQGENARQLEREQLVKLMSMYAETFLVEKWIPETGGRRLEQRIVDGEQIDDHHLRAWRLAREGVLSGVLRWVRMVVHNFYAVNMTPYDEERLLHQRAPEPLWANVQNSFDNLALLPCWVDKGLAGNVFGPTTQRRDDWLSIFKSGQTPGGVRVLAEGLSLGNLITPKSP